jgi:GNAT superfamily N-acetyltransferase
MKPIYKLQDVSADMKHQIVSVFNSEWGGAIVYTVDLLEKTWMRTEKDVLLVMIDPDSGDLVGTIGLDHKYLIPIAGHLYVSEKYRKCGYADVLINELEKQTDRRIYACCKPEKVAGNLRRGWIHANMFGLSKIMQKHFVPMYKQGCKADV